ncbi:MAG: hypothetical protein G8D89_16460 [gamma proteobacterium symbiont of Clathrolucina costata]
MARLLAIGCLAGMLGACASTPVSFNPDESKAMNIARAGGIDFKLKDTEVPKDTVNGIVDSAGYGFAMAASGYNAPLPGFSRGEMASMNFAAWLLSPEAQSSRNSMFAWMPKEYVGSDEEPVDKLADLILEATGEVVEEMGYEAAKSIANGGKDKSGLAVYFRVKDKPEDEHCKNSPTRSTCWISFGIRDPKSRSKSPNFVGTSGGSYFFNPSSGVYSSYKFPQENTGINELEFLQKLSAKLPEWVYFYAAPGKLYFGPDQEMKIPVIVNDGKVLYFVKPAR